MTLAMITVSVATVIATTAVTSVALLFFTLMVLSSVP